jgi:hypothetical protein
MKNGGGPGRNRRCRDFVVAEFDEAMISGLLREQPTAYAVGSAMLAGAKHIAGREGAAENAKRAITSISRRGIWSEPFAALIGLR